MHEQSKILEAIQAQERTVFASLELDYDAGLSRLNKVLEALTGKSYQSNQSIHWLVFSALSLKFEAQRILEIGTFDGFNALLMSVLFPKCELWTLDLPESDPILRETYGRENDENFTTYLQVRKHNVNQPRINFIESNSFFLPALFEEKFDLVWIDGGHFYPEVAWDLCNAYNICKPGGWIGCDDVYINEVHAGVSDMGVPLKYLQDRTQIDVKYFLKYVTEERLQTQTDAAGLVSLTPDNKRVALFQR
jgi:predicted O-methyltransferase YrrM